LRCYASIISNVRKVGRNDRNDWRFRVVHNQCPFCSSARNLSWRPYLLGDSSAMGPQSSSRRCHTRGSCRAHCGVCVRGCGQRPPCLGVTCDAHFSHRGGQRRAEAPHPPIASFLELAGRFTKNTLRSPLAPQIPKPKMLATVSAGLWLCGTMAARGA